MSSTTPDAAPAAPPVAGGTPPAPAAPTPRRTPAGAWAAVKRFFVDAYTSGVTGLSGMVAYNLLLSILPLALLALFVAGQVIQSGSIEDRVTADLGKLFPGAAKSTLTHLLDQVRNGSTKLGIVALVSSVWIGSSFWGALDTAFCRIYHLECRSWLRQKRFALAMLVVVILFMLATVAVPAAQSLLASGVKGLPFGLARLHVVPLLLTLAIGVVLLFGLLCLIYWAVPNDQMPWRAVWPGAALATAAISAIDYAFPLYLSNVSSLAQFGTTFVFVLIVLLWFYALALILLCGGVVNAMRCRG